MIKNRRGDNVWFTVIDRSWGTGDLRVRLHLPFAMKKRQLVRAVVIPFFLVLVAGAALLYSVPRDAGPVPQPPASIPMPPDDAPIPDPVGSPGETSIPPPGMVIANPLTEAAKETVTGEKQEPEVLPAEKPNSAGKLSLPSGFPKVHLNHKLQRTTEKQIMAGVTSYFVAEYGEPGETQILVRLIGLEKGASDRFLDLMLDAMAGNSTMEKIDVLVPQEGSGWERSGLYQRREAGIFYCANGRALMVISAPTPAEARAFGEALHAP